MIKFNLNLQIALYGLLLLLAGLVFLALGAPKLSLLVVPFTGVGASIMATGLTSWIITRHFPGVDVTAIIHALLESSSFVRVNHKLELTFSLIGDDVVHVTGEHSFTLINQRGRRSRKTFSIYTDLGSWHRCGGFVSVVEPTGHVLTGQALQDLVKPVNGKTTFSNSYDVNPKSTATFVFNTFGAYRTADRLIWTVQDLSTDFCVRLVNNTGIEGAFDFKINHHRESEIRERITTTPKTQNREVITLDFDCDVLPYQGFEVMWDLDQTLRSSQIAVDKGPNSAQDSTDR